MIPAIQRPFERVSVVGVSSSGKTTLASRLAKALGTPHYELDVLHWLPGWQERPLGEFRSLVEVAVSGERWVVDGNYSKVRDLVWKRATHIIWLNYSFPRVFSRSLRRTFKRVFTQEQLFGSNREGFRQSFLSRESILWWVITTYKRRQREYPRLFSNPENAHLEVIVFHSPRQADEFISHIVDNSWSQTLRVSETLRVWSTQNDDSSKKEGA